MNRPAVRALIDEARTQGRPLLDEGAGKRLVAAFGVRVPRGIEVRAGDQPSLGDMRAPYAAKLMSPDLVHKSDAGGVLLGLRDMAAVQSAVADLERLAMERGFRLEGVLVEEMAPPGVELVVGGFQDARFGPVLMLGLGGVFVEVMRDTTFRLCPVTREDAQDMIDELQGVPLLRGARGRPAVDEARIVDCLLAVGGEDGLLLACEDDVAELDINPLIVSPEGAVACDARVVLAKVAR